jgi:outer membrane protein OmpA-like peptidoglycan-associated protein
MKRNLFTFVIIAGLTTSLLACAGATRQQTGTGVGAGTGAVVGAVLGQAIGRNTEATLLGAGIGAAVGAVAGNQIGAYMDRQEQDLRSALATSEAASVQRTQEVVAASEARGRQERMEVLTATFKSEVMFDFDSATLKPGGYSELQRVADVLLRYPETTIVVEGHTDSRGSEAYNQVLSEKRAQAVRTALVEMGVAGERIEAVGYGESQPISSDDAVNRRVSIAIRPIVAPAS